MDRSKGTKTSMGNSSSLLPGAGHTPNYGINESTSNGSNHGSSRSAHSEIREHWGVVTYCALTACIISMVTGMSLSYSSIIINELNSSDSKFPEWKILSDGKHAVLIGGIMPAGAIFGGLFAWPISDSLGRQAALMIGGIPSLVGWIMISLTILAPSRMIFFIILYVGRALTGFASGWGIYCVSVYIAEVSSAKRKGLLGNCNQFFITIGILLSYILGIEFRGYRVPFYIVALVAAGIVTLFEFMMLFTHETPRWLFSKNREYWGIRVLKLLRGPDAHIMEEIDRIKAAVRRSYSVVEQFKEFKLRSVYHPFILGFMVMFFQQFSGINAAIFYTSTVFSAAGFKSNNIEICSAIAVGITQIVATFMSVLLIDRLGRRVLLVVSSIGMGFSSLVLAAYFGVYHLEHCDATTIPEVDVSLCSHLGPMAIVGVVIFIGSFSLGWGPIPWTSMSELVPNRVRGLLAGILTMVNWIFATTITFGFTPYQNLVTPPFAWATFSIVMVLSIFWVILFLPETKGRSLEQIQEDFERGNIFAIRFTRNSSGYQRPPSINSHVSDY